MRYRVVIESKSNPELGKYMTCGIEAVCGGTVLRTVHDVSIDEDKVNALAERFNMERLDPVHLDEAIEDFLYDFEV